MSSARLIQGDVLRMSTLFVRTLREDPADAEVASHSCSCGRATSAAPRRASTRGCRSGCACWPRSRRSSARRWPPIGGQEVHFPALLPKEPYEATGRWEEYGAGLFRLQDRKGGDYLLAPTHEEMFTLLVKDLYSSYKDLPLDPLPDPDQVPRRGPAPRRPDPRAASSS